MVDKVTINDDALNTTASTASTTQSTTSEASERLVGFQKI